MTVHTRKQIRHCLGLLLILLLPLGLAGCVVPEALIVKPPASAPSSTPADHNSHLAAALAYAPTTTQYIAFTDWTVIKQVAGVTDLTSADSMDERMDFMLPLAVKEQAIASNFGFNYFLTHAETWGWDSTDLLWEAMLTTDGPPIYLLRFDDTFDFTPVLAHLDERGYSTSQHAGSTLYSHVMDLKAEWIRTTEFAILNIAFLQEEDTFVLSSAPDSVRAVLDAMAQGSTLASLPSINAVTTALGDVGAAILTPLGCQPLDVMPALNASPEVRETFMDHLDRSGIRGLYDAFGLGYRPQSLEDRRNGESIPLGIFVHHYPIAEQAAADLGPRQLVAETATSFATNIAYAELFEVVDAKVIDLNRGGSNLILSLHALERPPQLFFSMFYQRDLLFSACGAF